MEAKRVFEQRRSERLGCYVCCCTVIFPACAACLRSLFGLLMQSIVFCLRHSSTLLVAGGAPLCICVVLATMLPADTISDSLQQHFVQFASVERCAHLGTCLCSTVGGASMFGV
jgi:hypothetical protein